MTGPRHNLKQAAAPLITTSFGLHCTKMSEDDETQSSSTKRGARRSARQMWRIVFYQRKYRTKTSQWTMLTTMDTIIVVHCSSLLFLYEYCTVSRQILGCRVFVYLEVCVRGSPAKVDSTMSFLSNGGRITRFYLILPNADSTNFLVDETRRM